jgi:Tol biopolymer transport system component
MSLKYLVILVLAGFEMLAVPALTAQATSGSIPPLFSANNDTDADDALHQNNGTAHDSATSSSAVSPSSENADSVSLSKRIPITGKERFLAPKWSPDGRYILLTKGKYRGLYIFAFEDKSIREISGSPGVGFDAKWSQDGRCIIIFEEGNRKVIDLNGKQVASEKAGLKTHSTEVVAKDDAIYLRNNQTQQEIKISRGEDKFFMPQLSPDRKKVAYIGLSSGIHIKNLENGMDTVIGLGTDIAWMPDSKGIVYTYSQDDGHKITSSDIFFADISTSKTVNLTNTPNFHENHPAPSPKGVALVYVVDGQVFLSELSFRRP